MLNFDCGLIVVLNKVYEISLTMSQTMKATTCKEKEIDTKKGATYYDTLTSTRW